MFEQPLRDDEDDAKVGGDNFVNIHDTRKVNKLTWFPEKKLLNPRSQPWYHSFSSAII